MANLMPCTSPQACPCPVGRCVPWGVTSGVHTSSQFAGLRNRDKRAQRACVPAPYKHTANYLRPRLAGKDLVLRASPRGHTGNKAMDDLGSRKGVSNMGGRPDGCGFVWPPLCLAFTMAPTPRCYVRQVLGDPCLHPFVHSQ